MKTAFVGVARQGAWHQCVRLVQQGAFDWDYLLRRSRELAAPRLMSLLLYAATDGIDVPRQVLADLGDAALASLAPARRPTC